MKFLSNISFIEIRFRFYGFDSGVFFLYHSILNEWQHAENAFSKIVKESPILRSSQSYRNWFFFYFRASISLSYTLDFLIRKTLKVK